MCFVLTISAPVFAKPPRTGQLYYNGDEVRTLVPSGKPLNKPGTDPLYTFPVGVADQHSITQFAPGDKEYRGGHWQVWNVTFDGAPYLITSYDDLMDAYDDGNGDINLIRWEGGDVLCPVLPGKSIWDW